MGGDTAVSLRVTKSKKIRDLEKQLDSLVTRGENCGKLTQTRRNLLDRADKVREEIRQLEGD
jgi:hypothetical protein